MPVVVPRFSRTFVMSKIPLIAVLSLVPQEGIGLRLRYLEKHFCRVVCVVLL
jgi:hypothetical protein